jgi:hypothetical protein
MGYQDKARRTDPRAPAVLRGRIAATDVSPSEDPRAIRQSRGHDHEDRGR